MSAPRKTRRVPLTPAEREARKVAHDFANEGDCLVCGDLAHLIGKPMPDGRILRPCFEWGRVVEETHGAGVGDWAGC